MNWTLIVILRPVSKGAYHKKLIGLPDNHIRLNGADS